MALNAIRSRSREQPVPDEYLRDDASARACARPVLLAYACVWGGLAAVALGLLPAWTLPAAAVMLSRAMTPFHEYYHTPMSRFPFWIRIIPVFLSPVMGGLREQRYLHFCHHRYLGDPARDPDHPIIHASLAVALLRSFAQPEHALWFSLIRRRLSRIDRAEALLRALLFALAVAALGPAFLFYLIPARLLWTFNYLAFSRMLHRAPLRIPWLGRAFYIPVLLGARWLPVFEEHDAHHRLPLVRAEHLRRFRGSP